MIEFVEMDAAVPLTAQMADEGGPVVLINTFTVPGEDADAFLAVWARDAAVMKRQPGFISTQLYRGIAGSGVFLNHAVWESTAHFRAAFTDPAFRAQLGAYPPGAKTSPHLFREVAVPGICVA